MSLSRQIWDDLTAPAPSIETPVARRQARLLSSILFVFILGGALTYGVARLLSTPYSGVDTIEPGYALGFFLTLGLLYGLSRTRHYRLAATLAITIQVIGTYIIATWGIDPPNPAFLVYLLVPILLVSLYLTPRQTLVVGAVVTLGTLAIPLLRPEISLLAVISGPLTYLVLAGSVYLCVLYHRNRLDRARNARLAERQRRYQALFERAGDGVAILSFEGIYLDVNQQLADMLGYRANELIDKSLYDTMAPEARDGSRARLATVERGQQLPIYRHELQAKDNRPVPVEMNVTAVHDEEGQPAYIQAIIRNVTQREENREALQRRNRDLMVLNRIIGAATSTLDNVRMLQVLCGELAYAFSLSHAYAMLVHQDKGNAVVAAEYAQPGIRRLLHETVPLNLPALTRVVTERVTLLIREQKYERQLGTWAGLFAAEDSSALLLVPLATRDRVQSILGLRLPADESFEPESLELIHNAAAAVAQAIETSELYRRQQARTDELEELVRQRTAELQEALKHAQAADEAKTQFVGNVSHELRTPLTSIRLYLNLADRGDPSRLGTYLGALNRETARLQHLVESLLLVSRLDLGKVSPSLNIVDLNGISETLVSDRKRLFAEQDLKLLSDNAPDLPSVQADRQLIEQVLTNLLTNAMNYTPPGGSVQVRTGTVERNGERWATVSISDTGLGISNEERKRLFTRFERGQASAALQVPGTGLGLAISKEIVELHGGDITVESALGEGSTFTVWLPVESLDAQLSAPQAGPSAPGTNGS